MRDRILVLSALLAMLTPVVWALATWSWRTIASPPRVYVYPPPETAPLVPPVVVLIAIVGAVLSLLPLLVRRLERR